MAGLVETACGALVKERTSMCLALQFCVDMLNLISKSLFSVVLTDTAQSAEKADAAIFLFDNAFAVGSNGNAGDARNGHDMSPLHTERGT